MKRLSLTLLVAMAVAHLTAGIHTYAEHSVLRPGAHVVKVRVQETGLYRLTYEDIQAMGLQPDSVRILGFGGNILSQNFTHPKTDDLPSVAFYMHKGDDGVFGKGDFILFYGKGNIGWTYSNGTFTHTRNWCADYGCYFVSDNAGKQVLIGNDEPVKHDIFNPVNCYTDYRLYEKELVNLVDVEGKEGGGREFYGEKMSPTNPDLNIPFRFTDVLTDRKMNCFVALAASGNQKTTFTIKVGGISQNITASAIDVSDFYTRAYLANARMTEVPQTGDDVTLSIHFQNGSSAATGYLNYIEAAAVCRLHMHGDAFFFRNADYTGSMFPNRYGLTGADHATEVWDLTDAECPVRVPCEWVGDTLVFYGNTDCVHEYVAVRPTGENALTPEVIGRVEEDDLADLHGWRGIQNVIIAPKAFQEAALRLAAAHQSVEPTMAWGVATDEQVYNEFSSGTPDVSAIRWFMKMLYDRAGKDEALRPRSLLLMGDGTFDNRQLLRTSGKAWLLTYQAENSTVETEAYASDDYFAFMEDNSGVVSGASFSDIRARMNFGVGRLPVSSTEQAEAVVDKIIAFMGNTDFGNWKQQLCFLSDDGDHALHVQIADAAAELVRVKNPDFIVNKIYLDAYVQESSASGESYPLAYNRFTNLLKNGVLFMDYSGHGSANNICSEMFLTKKDVENMTNSRQGLWALATCNFSHFDKAETSSAEEAVLNPVGGAIGVFSACRTVYASQNKIININFCDTLFGHPNVYNYPMTIGDAAYIAKNLTGNDKNKMAYVLLGDPAVRLNYPTDCQALTVFVKDSLHTRDTLHALDTLTIEGYIRADTVAEDTAFWFNGKLNVTIYDKLQVVTTRDNDEQDESKKVRIQYNDYPNKLFSGETDVQNGRFRYSFMLPKDIRYNYGNGRIVYYAYDPETPAEAVGHDEHFIIGGSGSAVQNDSLGPDMILYLNNPAFRSGDKTHERPHFYADLYDEDGINTVGSGIGHDLLLTVDNDTKQSYVLNDYFISKNNNFRAGQVSYLFSELSEGQHSLSFRAWDLLNNSSTARLDFEVVKGLDPTLFSVTAYPNPLPAGVPLNISVAYDRPDDLMETKVLIYDPSGRLVTVYEQAGDGNMSIPLTLPEGIYLYKLNIKSATTSYSTRTGKLIVR